MLPFSSDSALKLKENSLIVNLSSEIFKLLSYKPEENADLQLANAFQSEARQPSALPHWPPNNDTPAVSRASTESSYYDDATATFSSGLTPE